MRVLHYVFTFVWLLLVLAPGADRPSRSSKEDAVARILETNLVHPKTLEREAMEAVRKIREYAPSQQRDIVRQIIDQLDLHDTLNIVPTDAYNIGKLVLKLLKRLAPCCSNNAITAKTVLAAPC